MAVAAGGGGGEASPVAAVIAVVVGRCLVNPKIRVLFRPTFPQETAGSAGINSPQLNLAGAVGSGSVSSNSTHAGRPLTNELCRPITYSCVHHFSYFARFDEATGS